MQASRQTPLAPALASVPAAADAEAIGALELIDQLPLGIFIFARAEDGYRCQLANRWFEQLVELERPLIYGAALAALPVLKAGEPFFERFQACLESGQAQKFEWQMGAGPMARFFACHFMPLAEIEGAARRILGVVTDRSSEKLAERQLVHNALHDGLTGLPNRLYFQERVEEAIDKGIEHDGHHSAVLLLNVDRFQLINESLGHVAGDELLISLAARLRNSTRLGDVLARLGSDEFAILMDGIDSVEEAQTIAERIHAALMNPFRIIDDDLYVTISIGIASTQSSNRHPEDLIRDADFAMHRAKLAGRARTEAYHQAVHSHARDRFQLETDLRHAVELESLELYYQPIIDLQQARLAGFEALTRWPHPTRGMISPATFIPLAEETGIIMPLGRWAARTACRQLAQWRAAFGATLGEASVSINVSSLQLSRDDCARVISQALEEFQLPGQALRLELTESAILENPELVLSVLAKLRDLNVTLALDDFGTGYSSLSYLHKLPFDTLKIDRSFVNDLNQGAEGFALVETIVTLARSLGMSIVAEGVETKEQLAVLRDLRCDYIQGFLFAKPMPAADAESFIRQTPRLAEQIAAMLA
ncbi:MAG: putative bifunctional diguanylate cyclase/phosphodiesterase [Pseudomonadota bacterium]